MSEETIVAVFDSAEHADGAVRDLIAAGIPESAITRHAHTAALDTTAEPQRDESFWSRLFGGDRDNDHQVYDRSLESGSTVVSARVSEEHAALVSETLDRHHPVDIDERASSYGLSGATADGTAGVQPVGYAETPYNAPGARTTTEAGSNLAGTGTTAPNTIGGLGGFGGTTDGSETLRLAEERLTVGKRLVNQGTTRVRRYVVETPVEQQVSLHEQRVTLDRRPVTGTVAADGANFTDRTIELAETREEAVISKTAQIVEEVRLRKEAVDRVETIHDTVRREEVDVEKVPEVTAAPMPRR